MTAIDFAPKVEREVRKIEGDENLCGENRELLLRFKRDLKLDGLSDAWVHKLLTHLRTMGEQLGRTSFDRATEDDLKDVVEWVQDRDVSPVTKRDYRVALKRFYKWLNGGKHPERTRWIDTTQRKRNHKLPEKLLTEDDIRALIGATENPRDRALVSILWETGARIGEIMGLRVGSFDEHRHGKQVTIKGKTGTRRLPLISSVPDVNNWLRNHPKKEVSGAPLWCRLSGEGAGEEVSYRNLRKSLKRTAKKAGVDKPSNPHHFRHSRATYLASRMTESQLCEWFGWVQGSDRPATYVHMSGRDIDADYARLHGFDDGEKPEESGLSPEECPRCGSNNGPDAAYCQRCGQALSREAFEKLDREGGFADGVAEKIDETGLEGSLEELIERAVEERVEEEMDRIRGRLSQGNGSG